MRFYDFVTNSAKKVIFSLPVNTGKLKFVAFVVFVCTTASFIAQTFMEGHSGQKCNLIATCIPLDRIRVPLDRTFLPFDRTSIPFDRTFIPLDRTVLPFDRTSIILSLAI